MPPSSRVPANLRSLLVKVSPAPATLSERRAILRVLKRHGEVDVFKKLHDPSHFVSVVADSETVSTLVEKSPLEFDYVAQQPQQGPNVKDQPAAPPKTFRVRLSQNPEYKHRTHIRESQLYGRWPKNDDNLFAEDSMQKSFLSRVVPQGMAHAGLIDWESCGQLDDQESISTWLNAKADYVEARRRRRAAEGPPAYSLVQAYNAKHGKSDT